jgi:hypothetical protein
LMWKTNKRSFCFSSQPTEPRRPRSTADRSVLGPTQPRSLRPGVSAHTTGKRPLAYRRRAQGIWLGIWLTPFVRSPLPRLNSRTPLFPAFTSGKRKAGTNRMNLLTEFTASCSCVSLSAMFLEQAKAAASARLDSFRTRHSQSKSRVFEKGGVRENALPQEGMGLF